MTRSPSSPATVTPYDKLLERLDRGANHRDYPEGFGDSWTDLCVKAAWAIRHLTRASLQPATPTSCPYKGPFGCKCEPGECKYRAGGDAVAGEAKALAELLRAVKSCDSYVNPESGIAAKMAAYEDALRSPDVAATPRTPAFEGMIANLIELDKQRTPGPWKKTHDNVTSSDRSLEARLVARCDTDWGGGWKHDAGKASKNARFITALENAWPKLLAALTGDVAQPTALPNGWKLVPERPTHRQMDAGLYQSSADSTFQDVYSIYADMIDAAPSITDHPSDTAPVAAPTLTLSSTERK
jgi:hypothetical protein